MTRLVAFVLLLFSLTAFAEVSFTKLPDADPPPQATVLAAAFNPDSSHLALGITASQPPYLLVYQREGDSFTLLPLPSPQPSSIVGSVAFSPDSTYLAVGNAAAPYLSIYKRNGDIYTKLPDPAQLPALAPLDVTFSPDGFYLAVPHQNSPYLAIYKRTGDQFTRLNSVFGQPTGNGQAAAFSPDSTQLVVGNFAFNPPYLGLYTRQGDNFTLQPGALGQPNGSVQSTAFSPDGRHLALTHSGFPRGVWIYVQDTGQFTSPTQPLVELPGLGRDVTYSRDGALLAVAHDSGNRFKVFLRSGDNYQELGGPDVPPPGGLGNTIAISHDNRHLVVGGVSAPYLTIYGVSGAEPNFTIFKDRFQVLP